jgi:hypothetical protein
MLVMTSQSITPTAVAEAGAKRQCRRHTPLPGGQDEVLYQSRSREDTSEHTRGLGQRAERRLGKRAGPLATGVHAESGGILQLAPGNHDSHVTLILSGGLRISCVWIRAAVVLGTFNQHRWREIERRPRWKRKFMVMHVEHVVEHVCRKNVLVIAPLG